MHAAAPMAGLYTVASASSPLYFSGLARDVRRASVPCGTSAEAAVEARALRFRRSRRHSVAAGARDSRRRPGCSAPTPLAGVIPALRGASWPRYPGALIGLVYWRQHDCPGVGVWEIGVLLAPDVVARARGPRPSANSSSSRSRRPRATGFGPAPRSRTSPRTGRASSRGLPPGASLSCRSMARQPHLRHHAP